MVSSQEKNWWALKNHAQRVFNKNIQFCKFMHSKIFIALVSSLKWYQKGVSSLKLVSSQFICSKRPSTKKKEKNCWALKNHAQRVFNKNLQFCKFMHSKIFIALVSSLKWYQKGVSSLKLVSSQFICSKRPSTKKKEKNCWALKIQAQRCEHDKETDKVKCCCCSVLSILWNMASGLFLFVLVFHSIISFWIMPAQLLRVISKGLVFIMSHL